MLNALLEAMHLAIALSLALALRKLLIASTSFVDHAVIYGNDSSIHKLLKKDLDKGRPGLGQGCPL